MLVYHFYNLGRYDGETEQRIMCNFGRVREDGHVQPGQSQIVLSSEWPAFRAVIEANGWKIMTTPYNPAAHEFFLAEGYTYKHYDCEIYDDGDGESGPMVTGTPDADTYELDSELVAIDFNGIAEKYLVCPDPPVDPMSEDWQT